MVKINITNLSFASLLAGLYVSYHSADISAIPSYIWSLLAEELSKYMDSWMYDVQTLEDWIQHNLLITIKEVLTEDELEEVKNYTLYLEVVTGNATMVICGDIIWMNSSNISEEKKENM